MTDVKRLEYDATNDVLYVAGCNSQSVGDVWWCAGDRLARYDHFTDNSKRTTAWTIALPYRTAGSPGDSKNVKAICQAGDYLIFAEENGYAKIMMYRWFPPGANAAHSTVSPATGSRVRCRE